MEGGEEGGTSLEEIGVRGQRMCSLQLQPKMFHSSSTDWQSWGSATASHKPGGAQFLATSQNTKFCSRLFLADTCWSRIWFKEIGMSGLHIEQTYQAGSDQNVSPPNAFPSQQYQRLAELQTPKFNKLGWVHKSIDLSVCLPGSRTFFWALQVYSSWNDSAFPEQKLSPPKQAAWSSNSCLRIWRLRQTQFRNILEILKKKWTSKGHGYAPMCVTQFFTTSPLGIEKCLPFLNAHQNPHGCSIVAVQW